MAHFAAAYDDALSAGQPPDLSIGSTTTRLFDLVNRGPEFDPIYLYPPLLEACSQLIAAPFKLSSILARTLHPRAPAQPLHADLPRNSTDLPMLGFILMVDAFRPDNGATCFVPESHLWPHGPAPDQNPRPDETRACGPAGSLILFNAAVWHGHTANHCNEPRRSIQGYFVRRSAHSALDFSARTTPETLSRLTPQARSILALHPA